jgi:hypothetical protein
MRGIDPEQNPIHPSGTPTVEHAHRPLGVGTLRREWTPLGMLIERENCVLEAIEPRCALMRSAPYDPEVQRFEI